MLMKQTKNILALCLITVIETEMAKSVQENSLNALRKKKMLGEKKTVQNIHCYTVIFGIKNRHVLIVLVYGLVMILNIMLKLSQLIMILTLIITSILKIILNQNTTNYSSLNVIPTLMVPSVPVKSMHVFKKPKMLGEKKMQISNYVVMLPVHVHGQYVNVSEL